MFFVSRSRQKLFSNIFSLDFFETGLRVLMWAFIFLGSFYPHESSLYLIRIFDAMMAILGILLVIFTLILRLEIANKDNIALLRASAMTFFLIVSPVLFLSASETLLSLLHGSPIMTSADVMPESTLQWIGYAFMYASIFSQVILPFLLFSSRLSAKRSDRLSLLSTSCILLATAISGNIYVFLFGLLLEKVAESRSKHLTQRTLINFT